MWITNKILEWIIKKMISEPLERDLLITRNQHGFIMSKSCQTKLISFWMGLQEEAAKMIYVGFSKEILTNTSVMSFKTGWRNGVG